MKITKSQLKQIIKEELEAVQSEEGMESFVAKQFVGPAQHRMGMPDFDLALEKFEVKFNLDFPESVSKLHSILEEMGYPELANGLRHLYGDDVDYGKDY
jgi:hypothetical protein